MTAGRVLIKWGKYTEGMHILQGHLMTPSQMAVMDRAGGSVCDDIRASRGCSVVLQIVSGWEEEHKMLMKG